DVSGELVVKQKRFLGDVTDAGAQLLQRVLLHRNAIDEERLVRSLDQSWDQVHDCRLAAASATNKRNCLAFGNRQRKIGKDRLICRTVFKRQVTEFNSSFDRRLSSDFRCVGEQRLDVEDRIDSFETGSSSLIQIDDVTQRYEWPDQTREIHIENCELPNSDLPAERQWNPWKNDQYKPQADQKRH